MPRKSPDKIADPDLQAAIAAYGSDNPLLRLICRCDDDWQEQLDDSRRPVGRREFRSEAPGEE